MEELHFQWPIDAPVKVPAASVEWRPLARRPADRLSQKELPSGIRALRQELDEARRTISRLESDRSAARVRIGELEAAAGTLQARATAQRRQLLVLERQLEAAGMDPARDAQARGSWLDRLFGGVSSVATG